MDFAGCFADLGIKPPAEIFESTLTEAIAEYQKQGVFFLEDGYCDHVNSFADCLAGTLDELTAAAKRLRSNKNLALYALFLHRAMDRRRLFIRHLQSFMFPAGEETEKRLLPFLVLLPRMAALYAKLKARKVPEDIIAATLRQFEDCAFLTRERTGCLGYLKRYFDHMQLYVDEKVLNVGRLRFEMVPKLESNILVLRSTAGETAVLFDGEKINPAGKLYGTPPETENCSFFTANAEETETAYRGFRAAGQGSCEDTCREYPKDIWKPVLRKGDPVLAVHIPNKGALTKEACEESYRRAQSVFAACYPEFSYKAFHCHSWMLDPQLRSFLSESSNILAFQQKFTLYPGESQGQDVFNFVFKLQFKEYKDMPEDTSLQRALKKHYLAGKYIYEYEGLFFAPNGD